MRQKKWIVMTKRADFNKIAAHCGISPVLARLIRNRDVLGEVETERFLRGTLDDLHDPRLLPDAERAVTILAKKVQEGKRIRIIGDYDVDGICASFILWHTLRSLGCEADCVLPDRVKDGYGINERIVRDAAADAVDTIVTCDNGIAAAEPLGTAKELGLTVVVTDHHEVPFRALEDGTREYVLPPADAVVDPKIPAGVLGASEYPFPDICGAVVAYKLCLLLCQHPSFCGTGERASEPGVRPLVQGIQTHGQSEPGVRPLVQASHANQCPGMWLAEDTDPTNHIPGQRLAHKSCGTGTLPRYLLPFAGLATVCDVMPLLDENRIIVREGLKEASLSENPGLKALLSVTGLRDTPLTCYHAGFVLGPCLNATGRLDSAHMGLELFMEEDFSEALRSAQQLKDLNDSRKSMTTQGVEMAEAHINSENMQDRKVLVLLLTDCHESLAGIIAGRIKESRHRPVYVLTKTENGLLKGSGRSIESYDMYAQMNACSDLFEKFGGHKMAGGLTMREENFAEFARRVEADCLLTEEDLQEMIRVDMELPPRFLGSAMTRELALLEPCGNGNPKPLFVTRGIRLLSARVLGKNRNVIRLAAQDDTGFRMDLIRFGDANEFGLEIDGAAGRGAFEGLLRGAGNVTIDMVYYPEINSWNGRESMQYIVKDFRVHA